VEEAHHVESRLDPRCGLRGFDLDLDLCSEQRHEQRETLLALFKPGFRLSIQHNVRAGAVRTHKGFGVLGQAATLALAARPGSQHPHEISKTKLANALTIVPLK
jgi:hypothetical protein